MFRSKNHGQKCQNDTLINRDKKWRIINLGDDELITSKFGKLLFLWDNLSHFNSIKQT